MADRSPGASLPCSNRGVSCFLKYVTGQLSHGTSPSQRLDTKLSIKMLGQSTQSMSENFGLCSWTAASSACFSPRKLSRRNSTLSFPSWLAHSPQLCRPCCCMDVHVYHIGSALSWPAPGILWHLHQGVCCSGSIDVVMALLKQGCKEVSRGLLLTVHHGGSLHGSTSRLNISTGLQVARIPNPIVCTTADTIDGHSQ